MDFDSSCTAEFFDFLAGKHQLLVDGKWQDGEIGQAVRRFGPATGQTIATVAEADAADIAARRESRHWRQPRW
jgi:phenylacetaldehyde dehydrogenase